MVTRYLVKFSVYHAVLIMIHDISDIKSSNIRIRCTYTVHCTLYCFAAENAHISFSNIRDKEHERSKVMSKVHGGLSWWWLYHGDIVQCVHGWMPRRVPGHNLPQI